MLRSNSANAPFIPPFIAQPDLCRHRSAMPVSERGPLADGPSASALDRAPPFHLEGRPRKRLASSRVCDLSLRRQSNLCGKTPRNSAQRQSIKSALSERCLSPNVAAPLSYRASAPSEQRSRLARDENASARSMLKSSTTETVPVDKSAQACMAIVRPGAHRPVADAGPLPQLRLSKF